jgi:hypothetical protein
MTLWLDILRRLERIERDETGQEDPDDYGAEIVCEGRRTFIGLDSIPRRALNELLGCLAVSADGSGGRVRRFLLNETGRAILANPGLKDEIEAAVRTNRPFAVGDSDGGKRIVWLDGQISRKEQANGKSI